MAVYELEVLDFLTILEDEISSNIKGLTVTDALVFTEVFKTQKHILEVKDHLYLNESRSVRTSVKNLSVSDFLPLHDWQGKSTHLTVVDYLSFFESFKSVKYEIITDTLVFSESIQVFVSKSVVDIFVMSEVIGVQAIRTRTVTDTIVFASNQSVHKNDKYSSSITIPTLSGPNAPEC